MASSSSNIPPAKAPSSSSPPPSPSKIEQSQRKQKLLFKKKTVRPAKKRVIRRLEPMILAEKTTSGLQLNDGIDNTRMSQQCGSSGHGEVKSPAMVRAIEVPSTLSGSSGHANGTQAKTVEINVNNAEMIAGEDMCVEVHEKRTKASDSEHVAEGTRLAKPILQFKDVDGFHSFSIIVDGLAIDTDIPLNLLYTYYKLCVDQKSFLHNDLIKGLNSKLAAGIISETATIADAIKPAKLTVSLECLQSWDRTLKAFEDMGMKVGFLRARVNKLESLLYEQHEIFRSKKQEQNRLEEKIKVVESEQVKRYEAKKSVDDEIDALMVKISSLEVTLKNTAAAASW